MAADELRRQADVFLELEKLIPEISRPGNRRPVTAPSQTAGNNQAADLIDDGQDSDDGFGDYDDDDEYYGDDQSQNA
jgi:hypothetical protein